MYMFIAIYCFLGATFIHTQTTTIFTYVYVSMGIFNGNVEGIQNTSKGCPWKFRNHLFVSLVCEV
jgi:hypothetical protein